MNEKEQLISFIKEQINQGVNIDTIKNTIKVQGWTDDDTNTAISQAQNEMSAVSSTPIAPPASYGSVPVQQITQVVGRTITSKIITIVVILLVLGGVSAGAYFGYNYYKSSQITLGSAFLNTIEAFTVDEIKSGEFVMSAEITAKDVGKNYSDLAPDAKQITGQFQDVAVKFTYSGVVNKNENEKFETSGDINASIKNPTGGSLGMFGPQELALKYKTFSDNIYLNIQSIPSVASMIIPANIDMSKYLNQWFSMPSTMVEQTSKSFMNGFTASGTRNLSTTTISEEVKTQIVDLLDNSGAFTVVDKKSEKTDKGTDVTALYIKIDWDKLGDEIIRMNKESAEKNNTAPYPKSAELEVRTNLEKMKEIPTSNGVLKVLVGNDGYLYGYVSTGDLIDKENKQLGTYKVSFMADNFNKSFTIDRPANARSFMEVMTEINTLMNSKGSKVTIPSKTVVPTKNTTTTNIKDELAGIYVDIIHNGNTASGAIVISGVKTKALLMKVIEGHIGRLIPACLNKCTIEIVDALVTQPGDKQVVKVQVSNGTVKYFDVTDYSKNGTD